MQYKNGKFFTDRKICEEDYNKIAHLFIGKRLGIEEIELYFKGKYTNQQIKTALREILTNYGNWN